MNAEFVEIYNSQLWPEDISGYRIQGGIDYEFPLGTIIPAQDYLVIAKSPSAVTSIYGIQAPYGPFDGRLSNQGESLRLVNRSDAVLLEIPFRNQPPWPLAASGLGHSLALARPSLGESNPLAWHQSSQKGGSPGSGEIHSESPFYLLQINEVWRHPSNSNGMFIELINRDHNPIDLSGVTITVLPSATDHVIPDGVTVMSGGIYLVTADNSNLELLDASSNLSLSVPDGDRIIDVWQLIPHESNLSLGRDFEHPESPSLLSNPTPGEINASQYRPPIIFNELMFHPLGGQSDGEYLELYNRTDGPIELDGWQIDGDVEFHFPNDTVIPSKGYLVVAKNVNELRKAHAHLNESNSYGDFQGKLSNKGQTITLSRPLTWTSLPNDPTANPTPQFQLVDLLSFQDQSRWSQWADGGGSSLELKDPESDNDFAAAWADSDETEKSSWSNVELTGVLDRSAGARPRSFQIQLLGTGECMVDDIQIMQPGSPNQITNPSFESEPNDWVFQGNHIQSKIEEGVGIEASGALHITTTGRGDSHSNRIRSTLARGDLRAPGEATIRAKVRWLRGHPEILFRLQDNYIEAFHRMPIPLDLGTPGQRNSRWEDNSSPIIQNVQHQPVLPSPDDPILVTATIRDRNGIDSAVLNYRIDGDSSPWQSVKMLDDGSGVDRIAFDHIFTGTIPPQENRKIVAFHVEAVDQNSTPSKTRFPADSASQNCLVRIGDTPLDNGLGVYRLWVAKDSFDEWRSSDRPNASNEPLDATFVYNDERVIYNVGTTYSGSFFNSPRYTTPTGAACDYAIRFSGEDTFLGASKIIVSWPGLTGSPDSTLQREQFSYWMADQLDLPFNYRRYVTVFVNGTKRNTVMEDTQRPNQDMVQQWFPNDPDGDLHKIQLRYESDDLARTTTTGLKSASLELRTNPDESLQIAAYRWNWAPRSDEVTANDFEALSKLVEAVNISEPDRYLSRVQSLVDIDQWMRTFAVEHIVGNWDSYGYGNGQNMYAYKPTNGKWQLMIWDLDIGNGTGESARTSVFKLTNPFFPEVNGDTKIVRTMFQTPAIERAYWRALLDAVNGPMQENRVDQFLDTRFEKLRTAIGGNRPSSPRSISRYTQQRREYLLERFERLETEFRLISAPLGISTVTTDQNPLIVAGTGPIHLTSIRVNGVHHQPKWTDTTEWELAIPLKRAQTLLTIDGVDSADNPIGQTPQSLTVEFNGISNQLLPNLVFSEWMAINNSTLEDPSDGNFDDWFEIHNRNDVAINLSGFTLTDDLSNPSKWTFPEESEILPNGYLLVWADGDPSPSAPGEPPHVNFQLSGKGEQLALFDSQGNLIDSVQYPEQTADVSMGRFLSQTGLQESVFLPNPTPGLANPSETDLALPIRITVSHQSDLNTLSLEWDPILNTQFQLQFKPNLDPTTPWINLEEPTLDRQITIAIEPDLSTDLDQGFYRIIQLSEKAN